MEIQNSPCIETWRFCKAKLFMFLNLRVSIHGDSKISVYKTQKFFNLRVSIHGDSKIFKIATDDKNTLGCESGDWVLPVPIYEKNRVRKSHATVPLNDWVNVLYVTYIVGGSNDKFTDGFIRLYNTKMVINFHLICTYEL